MNTAQPTFKETECKGLLDRAHSGDELLLTEKVQLALSFEKSGAHQAAFLLVLNPYEQTQLNYLYIYQENLSSLTHLSPYQKCF